MTLPNQVRTQRELNLEKGFYQGKTALIKIVSICKRVRVQSIILANPLYLQGKGRVKFLKAISIEILFKVWARHLTYQF
jgi:hypothetical protein